ncbi:MAG: CoA transferase, partial [Pseudomonadota bacterium]
PINSYPDILGNEQVAHMNLVRPLELPNGLNTQTTAFPVQMSGYDFEVYRTPPELGADTDEVFAEWLPGDASQA